MNNKNILQKLMMNSEGVIDDLCGCIAIRLKRVLLYNAYFHKLKLGDLINLYSCIHKLKSSLMADIRMEQYSYVVKNVYLTEC